MANCTTLFSDGTFKSAPKLFYQLYVIFGVVDDRKLPLSWVLLKNKTTGIYRRMLQIFKKGTSEKKFSINGDGSCLRFWARFQISNRNGFYASPLMGLLFPFYKGPFEKDERSRIIHSLQGWSTSERIFEKKICNRLSASLLCAPKVLSTDAKHKCSIFEKRLSTTRFFPSVFRTHMVHHFPPECVQCLCAPSYFTHNQRMRGI